MTIRNRIFVYIFLSSVLIIVAIFMVVFYWFSNFYLRETINYAERMVRLVALESRDLILTNDLIELRNLYQATIVSNSHITYIFVEKNSEVLAHTFTKGVPRGLLNLEEFPDQSDLNMIPIENNEGDLIYHFRVRVGKPSFALMHLGISTQALEAELIPLHRLMILVGCFLTIVVPICVAYFLSRIISKPISTLRYGSKRIGKGELDYRLDINTGDEIEQLADEFNRMAERLERSYATLEQKVAERTESLQNEIGERRKALDELKRHEQMLEVSERSLKRFSRRLLSIREEEKKKLSNSLHDEIGSMTVALV
ncbi:MAG: HAMP domain-containing protein, partial [Deltaproteobacteria bacterium]|nr:HAMP domain-containing protein [Deltaproteobacteria bacterium]